MWGGLGYFFNRVNELFIREIEDINFYLFKIECFCLFLVFIIWMIFLKIKVLMSIFVIYIRLFGFFGKYIMIGLDEVEVIVIWVEFSIGGDDGEYLDF